MGVKEDCSFHGSFMEEDYSLLEMTDEIILKIGKGKQIKIKPKNAGCWSFVECEVQL